MTRNEAEKLLANLMTCQRKLDQILVIVEKFSDERERNIIDSFIKDTISGIHIEVILPTVSQYPDLDPYKDSYKS